MKLLNLELNNFLSYKEEEIALGQIDGVSFLIGKIEDDTTKSNGAGKSAIWDAVDWCLFCNSRVSDDNGLIRLGEDEATVCLTFELDGKRYSVTRKKKRNKSQTLAFYNLSDDVAYSGNSVKETQKKIIDVLGMDEELFGNTVFARQGNIDEFPRQMPSKRKEMLRNILKITEYEKWETEVKELARTYENQYANQKMQVEKLELELSNLAVTENEVVRKEMLLAQVKDKVERLNTEITQKENALAELKSSKKLLDKEIETKTDLEGDLIRIEKQIAYIDSHEKEEEERILKERDIDIELINTEEKTRNILGEINKSLEQEISARQQYDSMKQKSEMMDAEMSRLMKLIRDGEAEVGKLRKKLESFRELQDKCPLCNSVLSEEQRKKVESEIITDGVAKKKYRDDLQKEYDEAKNETNSLKANMKGINRGVEKVKELERDQEKYNAVIVNIEVAKSRVKFADAKLIEAKNSVIRQRLELNFERDRKKSDLARVTTMIDGYKNQLEELQKMESELNGLEGIRKVTIEEERQLSQEYHRLQYDLEAKKVKEKECTACKVKMEKDKDDYFIYSELMKAFGKDGIPLLVIENALAELQSEVQRQLEIMTDGSVMVEFATQRELKSGKTADTLDILVSDKQGVRDFNLYSGGERMRVALAIRLGLSKLLSRRAGKKFDILIIDEISDLDLHGMGKFVELINTVAGDYKQIFIVSHIDELKDRFAQVIQIVKTSDGSKVYM